MDKQPTIHYLPDGYHDYAPEEDASLDTWPNDPPTEVIDLQAIQAQIRAQNAAAAEAVYTQNSEAAQADAEHGLAVMSVDLFTPTDLPDQPHLALSVRPNGVADLNVKYERMSIIAHAPGDLAESSEALAVITPLKAEEAAQRIDAIGERIEARAKADFDKKMAEIRAARQDFKDYIEKVAEMAVEKIPAAVAIVNERYHDAVAKVGVTQAAVAEAQREYDQVKAQTEQASVTIDLGAEDLDLLIERVMENNRQHGNLISRERAIEIIKINQEERDQKLTRARAAFEVSIGNVESTEMALQNARREHEEAIDLVEAQREAVAIMTALNDWLLNTDVADEMTKKLEEIEKQDIASPSFVQVMGAAYFTHRRVEEIELSDEVLEQASEILNEIALAEIAGKPTKDTIDPYAHVPFDRERSKDPSLGEYAESARKLGGEALDRAGVFAGKLMKAADAQYDGLRGTAREIYNALIHPGESFNPVKIETPKP